MNLFQWESFFLLYTHSSCSLPSQPPRRTHTLAEKKITQKKRGKQSRNTCFWITMVLVMYVFHYSVFNAEVWKWGFDGWSMQVMRNVKPSCFVFSWHFCFHHFIQIGSCYLWVWYSGTNNRLKTMCVSYMAMTIKCVKDFLCFNILLSTCYQCLAASLSRLAVFGVLLGSCGVLTCFIHSVKVCFKVIYETQGIHFIHRLL